MRRRRLSDEERDLWSRVVRSAQALRPEPVPDQPSPAPIDPVTRNLLPPPKHPDPFLTAFRVGEAVTKPQTTRDLAPTINAALARQPVAMDRKTHREMTRGKLAPEARLDLHGMTLAEAYPELIHFVLSSHDRGMRLILVITGKGKHRDDGGPIPVRTGVLRHQVPQWLRLPPINAHILQITEAHLKHGGSGAYYIYLRRMR